MKVKVAVKRRTRTLDSFEHMHWELVIVYSQMKEEEVNRLSVDVLLYSVSTVKSVS